MGMAIWQTTTIAWVWQGPMGAWVAFNREEEALKACDMGYPHT